MSSSPTNRMAETSDAVRVGSSRSAFWAVAIIGLLVIAFLAARHQSWQWDFNTYYNAAEFYAQGGEVYDVEAFRAHVGNEVHPFLYPPVTLYLFQVLTWLPQSIAGSLWFALKLGLLAGLLMLWRRHFVAGTADWKMLLFFLLGFGATISTDLRTGNVSIVEQALLWSGFYFLLKKRTVAFCLCVIGASLFKWTPAVFLILPVLLAYERRWFHMAWSGAAAAATVALSFALDPSGMVQFLKSAAAHDERGADANLSFMAFIKDILGYGIKFGLPESMAGPMRW